MQKVSPTGASRITDAEQERIPLANEWHYLRNGESRGPFAASELQRLITAGDLLPNDLVWREGMDDWSTIASSGLTSPTPPPPPVTTTPATPPRKMPRPRRVQGTNYQRVAVWSIVGIVAVLLCVGWGYRSLRVPSQKRIPTAPGRATANRAIVAKRQAVEEVVSAQSVDDSSRHEFRASSAIAPPRNSVVSPMPPPAATESNEEPRKSDPSADASLPPPSPLPPSVDASPQRQTLFQLVDIRRTPAFSMQGLETKQSLHYQVVSQLMLERSGVPPTTKITQIIEDTRLVAADDSSRESFGKALEGLKRQQYTYRLNHRGEVIEFTGHKETREAIPLDLASATGFQLTSVIDEDGWKELAELTFVAPPEGQQAGETWKRQMTHDWGALGRWSGVTTFAVQPPRENISQIMFNREMKYTAAGPGSSGLPFQIREANFELQRASGAIEFDVMARRVQRATEYFDVRGTLTAELAGVGIPIKLTEQQQIEIKLSEQRPSLQ